MKDKIAALLAKAAAASPGDWAPLTYGVYARSRKHTIHNPVYDLLVAYCSSEENEMTHEECSGNAEYIAACSPDVITELCQAYLEQEKALEWYLEHLNKIWDECAPSKRGHYRKGAMDRIIGLAADGVSYEQLQMQLVLSDMQDRAKPVEGETTQGRGGQGEKE